MKQGKCLQCKIRWVWKTTIHSRECHCPDCGTKLQCTTHQSKLPVKQGVKRIQE